MIEIHLNFQPGINDIEYIDNWTLWLDLNYF